MVKKPAKKKLNRLVSVVDGVVNPKYRSLLVTWPLNVETMIEDTEKVCRLLKPLRVVEQGAGAGCGLRDIDFKIPVQHVTAAKRLLKGYTVSVEPWIDYK